MTPAGSVDGRRLLLPAESARAPLGAWQGTFDPVDGSAAALRYRFVIAAGDGRVATTDRASTVELTPLLVVAGAAFNAGSVALARWRYVVETDIDPAAADDFNAWYDEEHLPGLAAVAGGEHEPIAQRRRAPVDWIERSLPGAERRAGAFCR